MYLQSFREQLRKEAKAASTKLSATTYKPQSQVVLSGVERSSEIATPLMRFPTLPVSIPSFFGSNSSSASSSNGNGKKDKKKSQVPDDTVGKVLF